MAGRTIAIGDIHGCSGRPGRPARRRRARPRRHGRHPGRLHRPRPRQPRRAGPAHRPRPAGAGWSRSWATTRRCCSTPSGTPAGLRRWLACGGAERCGPTAGRRAARRRALADWIPAAAPAVPGRLPAVLRDGHPPVRPRRLRARAAAGRAARAGAAVAGHRRRHGASRTARARWRWWATRRRLSGEVLDLGFLVCIDTNCVRGGWLTALDTATGRVWQADRAGRLRSREPGGRQLWQGRFGLRRGTRTLSCDCFGPEAAGFLRARRLVRARAAVRYRPGRSRGARRLVELAWVEPWEPSIVMGFHCCDLCLYEGPIGKRNLFVPADGVVYVCPDLTAHYMNAHGYRPPRSF